MGWGNRNHLSSVTSVPKSLYGALSSASKASKSFPNAFTRMHNSSVLFLSFGESKETYTSGKLVRLTMFCLPANEFHIWLPVRLLCAPAVPMRGRYQPFASSPGCV